MEWFKKYWVALTVGSAFILTLIGIVAGVKAFDDGLHDEFVEEEKYERELKEVQQQLVALSKDVQGMAQSLSMSSDTQLYVFINQRIAQLRETRKMRHLTHQEEVELAQLEVQLHKLQKKLGMK